MFDISNKIAYDGLMVFGTPPRLKIELPPSSWINVVGNKSSEGHWIPEEGKAAIKLLDELIALGINPSNIFLISPFRVVVRQLCQITRRWQGINARTIHTVQGKESDIVILVLGGDPKKPGAKEWASKQPNLLNVAVSRARRRLYVLGHRETWQEYCYFNTTANLLSKHHE